MAPLRTPTIPLTTLTVLLLSLTAFAGATQEDEDPGAAADVLQRTGNGTIGPLDADDQNSTWQLQMTWTHAGSTVLSAAGEGDDTLFWCDAGRFAWYSATNTTGMQEGTGNWTHGTCAAQAEEDTLRLRLHAATGNRSHAGLFVAEGNSTAIATASSDATPQAPWIGLLVSGLATVFFLCFVAAGWLFVQERRLSRYLVRRLYEETKGRMPKDWLRGPHHQWIARAFYRSKN